MKKFLLLLCIFVSFVFGVEAFVDENNTNENNTISMDLNSSEPNITNKETIKEAMFDAQIIMDLNASENNATMIPNDINKSVESNKLPCSCLCVCGTNEQCDKRCEECKEVCEYEE